MSVDPTLAPQVAAHLNDHGMSGALARLIQRTGISSNSVGEWARAEVLRGTPMADIMEAQGRLIVSTTLAVAECTTSRDAAVQKIFESATAHMKNRLEGKTAGGIILAH